LEGLFPELQSENRVLAEANRALKQENYDHQKALSSQNHNLRQLETDLQRAYETRDKLSMKLQGTEERSQEINAWDMVLQAQHGTCKEQFTKDQLRDFEQGWQSIFLPVPMLCTDIIAILLTVHTSFGYGVIFSFFSFRSILDESYGFDDLETSLAYLSLLVGYGLAIVIHRLMERRSASAA
jgi:hypothetical protein